MKYYFFTVLFLLGSLLVFSQEELPDETVVDSEKTPEPLSLKDSIISLFKVDSQTERLDSLWKQSFYADQLFQEIYQSVTNYTVDDDIEYEALTTDTLKMRLARLDAKTPFNVVHNP